MTNTPERLLRRAFLVLLACGYAGLIMLLTVALYATIRMLGETAPEEAALATRRGAVERLVATRSRATGERIEVRLSGQPADEIYAISAAVIEALDRPGLEQVRRGTPTLLRVHAWGKFEQWWQQLLLRAGLLEHRYEIFGFEAGGRTLLRTSDGLQRHRDDLVKASPKRIGLTALFALLLVLLCGALPWHLWPRWRAQWIAAGAGTA